MTRWRPDDATVVSFDISSHGNALQRSVYIIRSDVDVSDWILDCSLYANTRHLLLTGIILCLKEIDFKR